MTALILRSPGLVYLEWSGTSLLLDASSGGVPVIVHWGAALGLTDGDQLAAIRDSSAAASPFTSSSTPLAVAPLLEPTAGWFGLPGVEGHRGIAGPTTTFRMTGLRVEPSVADAPGDTGPDGATIVVRLSDTEVGVSVDLELAALASGLLRLRATLTNDETGVFDLAALRLTLPIPAEASELLDFSGHWGAERRPQRRPLTQEIVLRENRRGRTGHDAAIALTAGRPGFGFAEGEVWSLHLGWSGGTSVFAQRMVTSHGVLGGGELLAPGEIRLATGESYTTPAVYAAYGIGLDRVARRFHDHLTARHPALAAPRPVTLNDWEAVYFEQTPERVYELVDLAAEVGVERFVVDDGWFLARHDDHTSLGDWTVDSALWPEGLEPLAEKVHGLGMQLGLWFEPEMINPDSELARAHPEWILGTGARAADAPTSRWQSVLNLADPDAYEHILGLIDGHVTDLGVDYIKWDHNRDLVDAVDARTSAPRVHEQTLATYRMMDELQHRHPGLEIESCASGGGRVDLGVLDRTQRIWVSDSNDPMTRQQIQRWTSQLVPLSMQGAHVASPRNHTTGRAHTLSFRAITSMFGHFGIEWDISSASQEERDELAGWVELYKEHRALIHGGVYHRLDHPDAQVHATGVVARDGSEAIYAIATLDVSDVSWLGRVRLAGLDPDGVYEIRAIRPDDALRDRSASLWVRGGSRSTGAALGSVGLALPSMRPEQALLVHLTRAD